MILTSMREICPGGRHAWYKTDLGFDVRKPVGQKIGFSIPKYFKQEGGTDFFTHKKKEGFWTRLIKYIKSWML